MPLAPSSIFEYEEIQIARFFLTTKKLRGVRFFIRMKKLRIFRLTPKYEKS